MGAWSHEPFGNDTAGDWADGLVEAKDLSYVEAALDKVLDQPAYLVAPDAEEAIAAVEVLAKMMDRGAQADAYTERVDAWIASMKQKPIEVLLHKAHRVLQRILSKDSELLELWSDADSGDWRTSMAALQAAVSA